MNEADIIKGCLKGSRESQKALYEHFYGAMYGLCLRYAKNAAEAKEMVHEGFLNVFNDLKNHKPNEPLDAWVKNIMIHSAIDYLRKNKENMIVSTVHANKVAAPAPKPAEPITEDQLLAAADKETILKAVQELAPAYRKVYNLNLIEGFPHKKIAEILNISEETSEITLDKAKFYLQQNIKQLITKSDGKQNG